MSDLEVRWRGDFANEEVHPVRAEAFGTGDLDPSEWDWVAQVERYSLGWVVARLDGRFVGFVNVSWDGDTHAFLEDVIVAADVRHQGVGVAVVPAARDGARAAGCEHLHVGFGEDLAPFSIDACGFTREVHGRIEL